MISNEERDKFIKNIKLTRRDAYLENLYIRKNRKASLIYSNIVGSPFSEEKVVHIDNIFPYLKSNPNDIRENFIKDILLIRFSINSSGWYQGYNDFLPIETGYNPRTCKKKVCCKECSIVLPDYIQVCPFCGAPI